jgi:phosphomevalonate kinase
METLSFLFFNNCYWFCFLFCLYVFVNFGIFHMCCLFLVSKQMVVSNGWDIKLPTYKKCIYRYYTLIFLQCWIRFGGFVFLSNKSKVVKFDMQDLWFLLDLLLMIGSWNDKMYITCYLIIMVIEKENQSWVSQLMSRYENIFIKLKSSILLDVLQMLIKFVHAMHYPTSPSNNNFYDKWLKSFWILEC